MRSHTAIRKCSLHLPILEDTEMLQESLTSLDLTPKSIVSLDVLSIGDRDLGQLHLTVYDILEQPADMNNHGTFRLEIKLSKQHYLKNEHLQHICEELDQLPALLCFSTECSIDQQADLSLALFAGSTMLAERKTTLFNIMADLGIVLINAARITLIKLLSPEQIDYIAGYLQKSEILCLGASLLLQQPAANKIYRQLLQDDSLGEFLANTFKLLIKKKVLVREFSALLTRNSKNSTPKSSESTYMFEGLGKTSDSLCFDFPSKTIISRLSSGDFEIKMKPAQSIEKNSEKATIEQTSTSVHSKAGESSQNIGNFSLACQKLALNNSCPTIRRRLHLSNKRRSGYLSKICSKDTPTNLSIFALQSGNSCQRILETCGTGRSAQDKLTELSSGVVSFLDDLVEELASLMSPCDILKDPHIQQACVRTGNKILLDALVEYAQNKMLHLGAATKVFGIMEELHTKGGDRKPATPSVLASRFIYSLACWLADRHMISAAEKTAAMLIAYRECSPQSDISEMISSYLETARNNSQTACAELAEAIKTIVNVRKCP